MNDDAEQPFGARIAQACARNAGVTDPTFVQITTEQPTLGELFNLKVRPALEATDRQRQTSRALSKMPRGLRELFKSKD